MAAHRLVEVDLAEIRQRRGAAADPRPFEYPLGLIFLRVVPDGASKTNPACRLLVRLSRLNHASVGNSMQIRPSMVSPKLTGKFVIACQEFGHHSQKA